MNQFARYAIGASRLEREGLFKQAAELWEKAYASPCGADNRHWAEARYDRCAYVSGLRRTDISERKAV
ncbi:ANR family transcriptional regulator [Pantoea rodasii]|nr:ANR family transcriptional regulator [Pantoea rodasii]